MSKKSLMDLENMKEFDNHQLISFFHDKKTNLKGFIAIHNINLGPAIGGTRYFEYASTKDALADVLRLSRAMTYKCALAGVPHGGGKGVIISRPDAKKTAKFLSAYAHKINLLKGSFFTGEDVGLSNNDVDKMSNESQYFVGNSKHSGDPSPWAALSVFCSIETALKHVFGNSSIKNRSFAIKGLGKVGMALCKLLYDKGGKIVGSDLNTKTAEVARKEFPGIKIVSPKKIHKIHVDVYAPCAMGGEFNNKIIRELNCRIICGGANNQLATLGVDKKISQRKILYIPDYVANAGGLINVAAELNPGGYSRKWVTKKTENVKKTVEKIIKLSLKSKKTTSQVADELAEKIFTRKK